MLQAMPHSFTFILFIKVNENINQDSSRVYTHLSVSWVTPSSNLSNQAFLYSLTLSDHCCIATMGRMQMLRINWLCRIYNKEYDFIIIHKCFVKCEGLRAKPEVSRRRNSTWRWQNRSCLSYQHAGWPLYY